MRHTVTALVIAAAVLSLAALGPGARYLEQLAIGGGYGDPADGGADHDRAGNISANGDLTVDGDADFGQPGGTDHAVNIHAGADQSATLNLYENDTNNGAALAYDGPNNTLKLGTYDNSTTLTPALEIPQGSNDVTLYGDLVFQSGASVDDLGGNLELGVPTDRQYRLHIGNTEVFRIGDTHFHARDNQDLGLSIRPWGTVYCDDVNADTEILVSGGELELGLQDQNRGILRVWEGSSGTAPATISMASPDGSIWYLFVEDDGTLKIHSSLPTQNSDGIEIGSQS